MNTGTDRYTRIILTVIAALLAVIALRPVVRPTTAAAQSNYPFFYVEPRTTTLRNPDGSQQLQGKVVIDLRNGDVWGFPTLSAAPYPVDPGKSKPPVSSPMYLGKFDFSKMVPR
jgi:hypothetical protein